MNQLASIIGTIYKVKENEVLFLHQPVTVRVNENTYPLEVHALCVSPSRHLYLMDGNGEWHELLEEQVNSEKVIAAVYAYVQKVFKGNMEEAA